MTHETSGVNGNRFFTEWIQGSNELQQNDYLPRTTGGTSSVTVVRGGPASDDSSGPARAARDLNLRVNSPPEQERQLLLKIIRLLLDTLDPDVSLSPSLSQPAVNVHVGFMPTMPEAASAARSLNAQMPFDSSCSLRLKVQRIDVSALSVINSDMQWFDEISFLVQSFDPGNVFKLFEKPIREIVRSALTPLESYVEVEFEHCFAQRSVMEVLVLRVNDDGSSQKMFFTHQPNSSGKIHIAAGVDLEKGCYTSCVPFKGSARGGEVLLPISGSGVLSGTAQLLPRDALDERETESTLVMQGLEGGGCAVMCISGQFVEYVSDDKGKVGALHYRSPRKGSDSVKSFHGPIGSLNMRHAVVPLKAMSEFGVVRFDDLPNGTRPPKRSQGMIPSVMQLFNVGTSGQCFTVSKVLIVFITATGSDGCTETVAEAALAHLRERVATQKPY